MPGFSEEKRAKLQALAEGSFMDQGDPDLKKFVERMETEKAPLFDSFTAHNRYFNAPEISDLEAIDVACIGVPFEVSAPLRAGTRLGPQSLRDWSVFRGPVHDVWKTIPFDLCSVADYGIINFESPHAVEDVVEKITDVFAGFRKHGIRPFSVGGVHTMTYPILKGLSEGEPVGCVHFDAHGDTARGEFQGSKLNDTNVFLMAALDEAIDPEKTVQIGIRNGLSIYWQFSHDSGMRVIPSHEFFELGVDGVVDEIKRVIGDTPFYLSLCTDGIDATHLPGTQLPEPFGLTSREVIQIIRGLRGMDMVGADIAELCPPYDPHGISANVCSAIGFEMVCLLAESHVAANGQKRQTHWS